jgi:menaquinone-9 beta-reductase
MDRVDVVIVGGGIAGGALATALARDGAAVVVLEASEQFEDRVRGESMHPWGVREAQRLGVHEVLLGAGAHVAPLWRRYEAAGGPPREIPVGLLVPGVDGTLNLEHRVACQALLDAATAAGAHVHRGVRDVVTTAGLRPTVRCRLGDRTIELAPTVVIGADGRGSVVRRTVGITLETQEASAFIAGLLLGDVDVPDDHDVLAEHEHGMFLLLHQGAGRARAYHVVSPEDRRRYGGTGGIDRFLEDAAATPVPWAEALRRARPAGPCATFPGTDTWTDEPYVDGVVLVGDAAGHNDPAIGCGLSIAMRDARTVHDLLVGGARTSADFAPYGAERMERMRTLRLIADVVCLTSVERSSRRPARRAMFAAAMSAMEAPIFPLIVGMFAGPETVPADLVDASVLDRIRMAAVSLEPA